MTDHDAIRAAHQDCTPERCIYYFHTKTPCHVTMLLHRALQTDAEILEAFAREKVLRRQLSAAHSALHSGESCGSMHDDIQNATAAHEETIK